MNDEELQTFDFLINEEDEVMLLLYAQTTEPNNPSIKFIPQEKCAILNRTPEEEITLTDIPDEVFDSLAEADKLMVCELSAEEKEEDTKIIYAYEAEIND